jgi:alkylation response protein AidB-like acyl-CoA dehydrogenase
MSAVSLGRGPASEAARLTARTAAGVLSAADNGPRLDACLRAALSLGEQLPPPGKGSTLQLWEALATLGAADLTLARVVEPHLDALAILTEAGHDPTTAGLHAVYAAEVPGGRDANLQARSDAHGWLLEGTKPWCSLAAETTTALVTAWVDDTSRGLFLVELGQPAVRPRPADPGSWVSRGLSEVTSLALDLDGARGEPVGGPGWYLTRPGFAWGGLGVAAIWYGAAVALARTLRESALRRTPDQVALVHLGAVDAALAASRAALLTAATVVDSAPAVDARSAGIVAARTRQVVADAAEAVLTRLGHALGPGPLTRDEQHARRVADLTVYLRQHHAERDLAALGQQLLTAGGDEEGWW